MANHQSLIGPPQKFCDRIIGLLGIAIILYLSADIAFRAYIQSIRFDGYFADGAFQLFDPLRRMADGQIPGHDFQFFHGLGTLYIHYPIFSLFGKDLFASEISRQLMSPTLFIISTFLFFIVISRKWQTALLFTGIFTLIAHSFTPLLLYTGYSLLGIRTTFPIIFASIVIILLQQKNCKFKWLCEFPTFQIIAASMIAIAFFISLEHGLYLFIAFIITEIFIINDHKELIERVKSVVTLLVLFLIGVIIIFITTSGQYFLEPIIYGLISVPEDQFWYFGVPPNEFIKSFEEILTNQFAIFWNLITILLIIITVVLYRYKKNTEFVGICLLLIYSMFINISLFGIYTNNYLNPMVRIDIIVMAALVLIAPDIFNGIKRNPLTRIDRSYYQMFLVLIAMLIIIILPLHMPDIVEDLSVINTLNNTELRTDSGVYLSDPWRKHVESFEEISGLKSFQVYDLNTPWMGTYYHGGISQDKPAFVIENTSDSRNYIVNGTKIIFAQSGARNVTNVMYEGVFLNVLVDGPPLNIKGDGTPNYVIATNDTNITDGNVIIWSFYSSIIESNYDIYNPSTDYIIHALGPERRKDYLESFKETKPQYVRTDNKEVWPYGEWIINEHWDFYSLIVDNYEIDYYDEQGAIWKRVNSDNWQKNETWEGEITGAINNEKIIIPLYNSNPDNRIVEVNVSYEISNPWKIIPIFGKVPRYMIYQNNTNSSCPVSLPPYRNSISFPIYLKNDNNPSINFTIQPSCPGTTIEIKDIHYRYLNSSKNNEAYLVKVNSWWKVT